MSSVSLACVIGGALLARVKTLSLRKASRSVLYVGNRQDIVYLLVYSTLRVLLRRIMLLICTEQAWLGSLASALMRYLLVCMGLMSPYARYFKITARRPHCPFGDECFYQHADLDGTRHNLGYGLNTNVSSTSRSRRNDY
jgi:Na+-transporting NADH:ubiquinone oxidoreductase subunit NqrB